MGYIHEVEMIARAHELDLITCPYVFNEDEAKAMAKAGADLLIAHMGLTTKGTIGARTAITLDQAVARIQAIQEAAVSIQPEILVLCHGGPIAEPDDVQYILDRTKGVCGFFGASSIERLPTERAISEQGQNFKNLKLQTERSEPRVTGTERFTMGVVLLQPGKGHVRHNHPGTEEILYVVSGQGKQMIDVGGEQWEPISAGGMIHIPPAIFHATITSAWEPLKLIAVYSPPGPEALLRAMPECRVLAPGVL